MTDEVQKEARRWKKALTNMANVSERKRKWAIERGMFDVAKVMEVYSKSLRTLVEKGPPE